MAHDAMDPVQLEIERLQAALLGKLEDLKTVNEGRVDIAEQIARKARDSRSLIAAPKPQKQEPDLTSKFAAIRNGVKP